MIWLALLFAIFASAVFAAAETALYAVSPLRLVHGARHSRRARWQLRVSAASASYLCALLVGNNIANDAAVHAAGEIFSVGSGLDPHLMAALALTPIIFVFGEVLPKQLMLASSYHRNLMLTPFLVVARVVLWPVSTPLAWMLRAIGLEEEGGYRRSQLGALLLEGSRDKDPETAALVAAHRALQASGKGLTPFIRQVPLLPATLSLDAAREQLSVVRDGLALIECHPNPPKLLLGSRLARAADDSEVAASAKEIPQLDHTLELSEALEQMRRHNANFALVKTPDNWSGILDLEDILANLFAPAP